MLKNLSKLFFLLIPLSCFLVGCGMDAVFAQPPTLLGPQPTTLQVTRTSTSTGALRSWTITDVRRVQQLFQEIQRLPGHQNNGADSCVTYPYTYALNFFAKSLQQDDLGRYCGTLTLANGRHLNPTATFNSLLRTMLNVNDLWASRAAPLA